MAARAVAVRVVSTEATQAVATEEAKEGAMAVVKTLAAEATTAMMHKLLDRNHTPFLTHPRVWKFRNL